MEFSPRLIQILFLLVNSEYPVPAGMLAEQMQISKRTVFRELEHIDRQLKRYDLKLETKSKKGISLNGSPESRSAFREVLKEMDCMTPWNKEDRQRKLILELLEAEEPRKVFYLAQVLLVSEGTVNKDLEQVERWFREGGIRLVRRPGTGVYLNYEEEIWRRAFMRYIYQNMKQPYEIVNQLIGDEIVSGVRHLVQNLQHAKVKSFTEYSYMEFIIYLSIMVYRILAGNYIREKTVDRAADKSEISLCMETEKALQDTFGINLTEAERCSLHTYIKGVKLQYIREEDLSEGSVDLQCTIYEMIHQYDQTLAWQLKNEEEFVKGLLAHLKPTIMRLQNNIVIHNPFQQEVMELYPEVYRKTERAAGVLENSMQTNIPEEEIGLLALHFGGAEVRIRNREKTFRKVQVGVICASGIGMSTLLSSRIQQLFGEKIETHCLAVSDLKSEKMSEMEVCVSTFELSETIEDYIRIHPMLPEEDIARLAEKIEAVYEQPARPAAEYNVIDKMEDITLLTDEITSIVKHFGIYHVNASSSFHEVVRRSAEILGEKEADQNLIYDDICQREMLSTQVIPEFGFTLLHAKTNGVSNSRFVVILPDEEKFMDPYFEEVRAVMVMLIVKEDKREQPAISAISTSLFEDEMFLDLLIQGNDAQSRRKIERILNQYFISHIKNA